MKPYTSLKSILTEFFPLHRTLASADQDKTLEIIGSYMPDSANYTLETYAPLTPVWTWNVPERYVVHEAYLEIEGGERIVDFKNNPLHIVSYSVPVDKSLSFEELQPHLYFNEKLPHTIPWVFKYYERDWGFCLLKNLFDQLPRDKKYRAVIKSEFITDPNLGFKVATAVVHPEGGANPTAGEFIVQAHTCHPMQANDDGAGVVNERPFLVWSRNHRHDCLAGAQRKSNSKSTGRHLHGDDG
jgi:aminopeptidase-like protein